LAGRAKINLPGQGVVGPQQLHGVEVGGALIGAMDDVAPQLHIMPTVPGFAREEVAFLHLLLIAAARPGVEEVALPPGGSNL